MKEMIEGKGHGKELLETIVNVGKDIKIPMITTMANLLRAIYLSDENTNIKQLKKIIEITKVFPSFADFRDEKKVIEETIKVANALSKKRED